MDNNLKITDFGNNILYIENAFPKHKEFLEAISDDNLSGDIVSIIPKWSIWLDGKPEYQEDDWEHVFPDKDNEIYDAMQRGIVKTFDWDRSINNDNNHWPRIQVNPDYSNAHKKAHEIIKMIDEPYKDMLEIWRKKFNEYDLQYISKNYCIRQYKVGGDMGVHVDRHVDNPRNNMDWTALIYLTDTYEGGELVFDDYKITLRPSAGSIIFFPCLAKHSVNKVLSGNKTYIFLFIHTEYGLSTSLGEPYQALTDGTKIKNKKIKA